jgi:poly(3-hydroxybutyrate) depolymerase
VSIVVGEDGRDHLVDVVRVVEKPFGDLSSSASRAAPRSRAASCSWRRCRAITPRSCARPWSLLPDCEVWITDWHNARDIPVSKGKFDVEDYTLYLVEFMRHLGPDTM